ncbi:hypothetical protein CMUS01_04365 [Colletotrichum musicola]|uniref:Heterokaryon incompatibility domain-containing protein n=1 Tax=Colletotrichum musicola TaxID=2175873 RepID=A0A8H6KX42_9PEZI|nr:hypothetical protein CMUS01_04365 [Colletotrichum musicola]
MEPIRKWVFRATADYISDEVLDHFHQPYAQRRAVPLVTHSLSDPEELPQTERWTCLGKPATRVPPLLRLSYWIGSSIFVPGTREYRTDAASLGLAAFKLVAAWPLLCLLVWPSPIFPASPLLLTGEHGQCPPTDDEPPPASGPHGNGSEPGIAPLNSQSAWTRAVSHMRKTSETARSRDSELDFLRPRYLCFVVSTEEEIAKYPYKDEATREANRQIARADRSTLVSLGIMAAKRAGKRAFWLDFECVRDDDETARSTSSSHDVYRICDIVRAAHSMVIAIGPTASDKVAAVLEGSSPPSYGPGKMTTWLRQWGSRLWTLPELLLCPSEFRIQIHPLGCSEPRPVAKRNFAELAWDDAEQVNELVSHFEGTATLIPLHFIQLCLECFSRRQTNQFSQGDVAYATMGLFPKRQRPVVNKHDSGFEAFAKLCLCNDSGDFLERLICVATRPGTEWYRTEDCWNTKIGDIRPLGTVRTVTSSGLDTVVLDGVRGVSIHWDGLDPEPYFDDDKTGGYAARFFTVALMWCLSAPLIAAFSVLVKPELLELLPITALFALVAPVMLLKTRARVRQPPKAKSRLVGIEGLVDAGTVEKHLWGFDHGNLTNDTALSYGQPSSADEGRFFTLLDTGRMTVTHFQSFDPPIAMLLAEEEGGRWRALLCSYNHKTRTFHREQVLRIKCDAGTAKEIPEVDGLRLSLFSQSKTTDALQTVIRFDRIAGWAREFMFLGICAIGFSLFHHNAASNGSLFYYRLAVIVGQVPALAILSFVAQPFEMLPCILSSKLFLNILASAIASRNGNIDYCTALHGLLDGVVALLLITTILSWYAVDELIIRFLLWAVLSPRFTLAVSLSDAAATFLGLTSVFICFKTFDLVLDKCKRRPRGFSGIFGRPSDVAWLPTDQKSLLSLRAAMGKFTLHSASELWLARQPLFNRLSSNALIFAAAVLSPSNLEPFSKVSNNDLGVDAAFVVIAVALGLVMHRAPSVSFIWTITVHEASTWFEAAGTICLSQAGVAVGQRIFDGETAPTQDYLNYVLLLSTQITIWTLLWLVYRRMGAGCVSGEIQGLWSVEREASYERLPARTGTADGGV